MPDSQLESSAGAYPGALRYLELLTEAAERGELDAHDMAIMTALAIRFADYNTGENAWPSLSTLAACSGSSRAQVKRRLSKLEGAGWITRRHRERKPSIITLFVPNSTGQADPRVSLTLGNTGQTDPRLGSGGPHLGSGGPGGRVSLTPDRTQRTYPKNIPQEQEGGDPAVVPRAQAGVPARDVAPPVLESDVAEAAGGEVDPFGGSSGPSQRAVDLGIRMRAWLETEHGEQGHRSDTLARLIEPLLESGQFDEATLAQRVTRELPAYHARHPRKRRAIASLLSDLANPNRQRSQGGARAPRSATPPPNAYYRDEEKSRWLDSLDSLESGRDSERIARARSAREARGGVA